MADFSFEDNNDIKQGGNYTTIPTKNVLTIKKIKIQETIWKVNSIQKLKLNKVS